MKGLQTDNVIDESIEDHGDGTLIIESLQYEQMKMNDSISLREVLIVEDNDISNNSITGNIEREKRIKMSPTNRGIDPDVIKAFLELAYQILDEQIFKNSYENEDFWCVWNDWRGRDNYAHLEKTFKNCRFSHAKLSFGVKNGMWYCAAKQNKCQALGYDLDLVLNLVLLTPSMQHDKMQMNDSISRESSYVVTHAPGTEDDAVIIPLIIAVAILAGIVVGICSCCCCCRGFISSIFS